MTQNGVPRAPTHLRPETRVWWRSVLSEWDLESHDQRVLTAACECWDRGIQAREAIERDGAYLRDRFGQLKAHPALSVERLEKLAFARLLKALDLEDVEPPTPYKRTPRRH